MKFVECWRWRYRDPKTDRLCRTLYAMSEEEARKLPQRERIPGTMILREVDLADFADTLPDVGYPRRRLARAPSVLSATARRRRGETPGRAGAPARAPAAARTGRPHASPVTTPSRAARCAASYGACTFTSLSK